MSNIISLPVHPKAALRRLLTHHLRHESLTGNGQPIYWVTCSVGRPRELGRRGRAELFGFLIVAADGPIEAETQARRILAARTREYGTPYTVTAVHSTERLIQALCGLELVRAGALATTPIDSELEDWEEQFSDALVRYAPEAFPHNRNEP